MPEPVRSYDRLKGKIAVVTGAGAEGDEIGLGRAIALLLAREGASVVCADLDASRAEETASRIVREGGRGIARAGDVSCEADCATLVEAAVAEFGGLDVLVNNVGISTPTKLETVTLEQWNRVLGTNLTSAMLMSKYAVPAMKRSGGGAIVNISSLAGMRAMGALAYGPSKAAMAQLAREIALLHGRDGIRANAVAPGHVLTPHAQRQIPADMREARRKVGPLGVEGDAWDVARAVLFLVSDDARFVTGVELAVDGGVTAIGPLAGHALIAG